jgi:hypothetical protein
MLPLPPTQFEQHPMPKEYKARKTRPYHTPTGHVPKKPPASEELITLFFSDVEGRRHTMRILGSKLDEFIRKNVGKLN